MRGTCRAEIKISEASHSQFHELITTNRLWCRFDLKVVQIDFVVVLHVCENNSMLTWVELP